MNKRRVAYCSTCEKFLPKPALRLACEAEGHRVTTEGQKITASNRLTQAVQTPAPELERVQADLPSQRINSR